MSIRDFFETIPGVDPIEAARRGARPTLRRRFYEIASVAGGADGHVVQLDGKPVYTPGRRLLVAPEPMLADAIAAEWNAQREVIDPITMPLTRLANLVIDGVAQARSAVADEVGKYLASDLLFYRAGGPRELRERQAREWDPILAWAGRDLGAAFTVGEGIVYVPQTDAALKAARAAIPAEPWRLGAVHVVTTLTGSALIALALAAGRLSAETAWRAAHVDEDWNMERWGRDPLALERRAFRFAEFEAAVAVLAGAAGHVDIADRGF